MKNIKLKYFAVALMMVLQWSCATTEIPEAGKGISKTDLFSEGSMLNEYKNFKIDGVITNDTKKIEEISNNAHAVVYDPEIKEVDFYSTEASYCRFNPEIEQNAKVTESVQAATGTSYPDNFTDIGSFGTDAGGVSGLGTILDQGYFRNFANNIYFVIKPIPDSDIRSFYRLNNLSNSTTGKPLLQYYGPERGALSNKFVVQTGGSLKAILSNVSGGSQRCTVINDTDNNRNLIFYKDLNYGGSSVIVKLAKNAYTTLSSSFLSSIGGTANSYKSVTY